jgi:hypothetical protein
LTPRASPKRVFLPLPPAAACSLGVI